MTPVYPLGVNVLLARVGGVVYAVSGRCAHMACPLFMGRLEGYTIICPCQPLRHERARDMQIVCPCIPFHRKHFDAIKRCWCGLFVHKDVTDPDSLPQLSPKDVGLD